MPWAFGAMEGGGRWRLIDTLPELCVVAFSRAFRGAQRISKYSLKIARCKKKAFVNQSVAHSELIATYKRAQADAAHKQSLIKAVAAKGPKAIRTAADTAAKAVKRRDSYAEKLAALGVVLKDEAEPSNAICSRRE